MSFFNNLKVIELASVLAGPSVGQFFAELGAHVLKIENPATSGDVTRSWKLPSEDKDSSISSYFCAANWGKKTITLDIKKEEDLKKVYQLIEEADIVITSYKPGDAQKLKVDYTTLSSLNDRIIYGDISGYTTSSKPGYDAIIQAESGFMYMNGQSDTPPTKMPVALIDILTAHQLKEGILVALLQREKYGKGDFVEVSLFDTAISSLANQGTNWLIGKKNPQRIGSEHPNIVPYGTIFTDCDRKELVLAVGNDKQFHTVCSLLGISEIAEDDKFKHNYQRVNHREELKNILQKEIQKIQRKDFLHQLEENKVPAGAVNSVKEALETTESQRLILSSGPYKGIKNIAFRLQNRPIENNVVMPPKFNTSVETTI